MYEIKSNSFIMHRPEAHTSDGFGASKGLPHEGDGELIHRIAIAYNKSINTYLGSDENFWLHLFGPMKAEIHHSLKTADLESVAWFLRNPGNNHLFYGFEALFKGSDRSEWWQRAHCRLVYNELLRLCEAVGVVKLENPEFYNPAGEPPMVQSADALLSLLDETFGFRIDFPNPYEGEQGLASSRGIATLRSIDALYEAWRIWTLIDGDRRAKVLEIGAGLGRVAYFASKFGVGSYTIIDIPMTSVAQSYFLGRVLGPDVVQFFGEVADAPIRVQPPVEFLERSDTYDLVINADSLPEMDREIEMLYAMKISRHAKQFLSINHEARGETVRSLFTQKPVYRFPYWLRRGYVEELWKFPLVFSNE